MAKRVPVRNAPRLDPYRRPNAAAGVGRARGGIDAGARLRSRGRWVGGRDRAGEGVPVRRRGRGPVSGIQRVTACTAGCLLLDLTLALGLLRLVPHPALAGV